MPFSTSNFYLLKLQCLFTHTFTFHYHGLWYHHHHHHHHHREQLITFKDVGYNIEVRHNCYISKC